MIFGVRGVCPLKFYYVNAEGANPLRLRSYLLFFFISFQYAAAAASALFSPGT